MNLSVTGSLALAHNRPTLNGDLADAPRHLDDASPKKKTRLIVSNEPGRNSGDVLLSHNLSSHYHRGCSVSLPCSEWERVGPLRYDHQRAGEAEATPCGNVQGRSLLNFTRKSGN